MISTYLFPVTDMEKVSVDKTKVMDYLNSFIESGLLTSVTDDVNNLCHDYSSEYPRTFQVDVLYSSKSDMFGVEEVLKSSYNASMIIDFDNSF